MKIRLHNSLGKTGNGLGSHFLFDDKIFVRLAYDTLYLRYRVDDSFSFMSFSIQVKEFVILSGFGENDKRFKLEWRKDPIWNWKEIGK